MKKDIHAGIPSVAKEPVYSARRDAWLACQRKGAHVMANDGLSRAYLAIAESKAPQGAAGDLQAVPLMPKEPDPPVVVNGAR